jgi:hypothetical protein
MDGLNRIRRYRVAEELPCIRFDDPNVSKRSLYQTVGRIELIFPFNFYAKKIDVRARLRSRDQEPTFAKANLYLNRTIVSENVCPSEGDKRGGFFQEKGPQLL